MLIINVCNNRQNLRVEHAEGPLEFGRGPERAVKRIMLEDIYVSRDQLSIEEIDKGRIQVANLSQKRGNTGCSRKFKYGPHGHAVNLADRVQDATTRLGVPILITGRVRDSIPDSCSCAEVEPVHLAGMTEEVVLYELKPDLA